MFAKYQQNSSQKIREISKIFSRSLKQLPSWLDIVRQKISNISLPKIKKQTKTAWKKTLSFSEINIRKIKNLKKEDLKRIFSKDYLSQILKTIYQIETKQKIIFSLVLLLIGGVFGIIKHNQSTMIPDAVFRRSVLSSWDYTSDSNESGMTTKLKKEKSALAVLISREKSQIEFKLPINNPSLKVQDNTATYTNEDQSIEIKYEIQPTKLKESIILNSPTSKSEFTSNFTVRNLIVKVNNENIPVFFDTKNNYQFHLERPFATDAAGKTTFDLVYELKPKTTNAKDNPFKKKTFVSGENLLKMESLSDIQVNTNEYELIVSVDPSWLNAPDRQYPVIIDPTVTHDTTAEFAVGSFSRLIDSGSGSSPVLETYYQESIADEHTVLLWHMNETANDTCPSSNDSCDASGTGNHGSATGTTIGTGKISYGRTFNGTSDYISVADTNSLDLVKDYTLETWIYPTVSGNSTYRVFLAKRPSSGGNYELYLNNDAAANQGELRFWNGVTEYATGYVPKINTWTHIAAVVTNTTNLTMYVNGEVVSSQTIAAPVTFTGSFTIGRGGDIANYYFQGSIDEVRVSNIARSQEEIKMSASRRPYAVYTSDVIDLVGSSTVWDPFTWTESGVATGNGETLKNSTGLVAQWNFNETSGTTADNTEGTATYDGTLSGFDSKASQDADQDSGWTANNKRWGAGALQFDGIDSVVSIGAGKFDVLTDVSIEMWLKYAGSFSTNQVFFSRYKDGNNRMPIFVSSSTRKIAFENIVGGVNRAIYSDATINPGSWYHLVFSCGAGGMKMYVNGVQQTSTNATTDCFSTIAATVSNDIGAHNSSAYFPGTIDSTRIYSRELTAAEILSNYNSTNIEIQTRVGHNNAPYSEAWEDWSPTSGETTINNLDDYSPIGCSAVGGTTTDGGKTYVFTKNDTIVYGYTGSDQTYTVPAGVTSIDVEMWGGGGGGGNAGGWSYGFAGGGGGYTTGTLAVTPGQVLTVMVGAGGTNGSIANTNPSYGGGARSCNTGTDCRYGGQGGGRSAIRYSSADVITAGGGGGGGSSRVATGELGGGGGGNAGADGSSYTTGCRGRGGTQSAGGAGGSCGGSAGTAGSQYTGGNPASNSYGGGGGGGYYGGGGGGYFKPNDMGGGGGGSGYIGGAGGITVTNGTTTAAGGATQGIGLGGAASTNGTNGKVIVSYTTTDRNHATPTGTTVTNGISGKARSFNGSSDFVLIPASSNLDVQNLTIEAWVYSDNFNQSGFIFEKTTNGLVNTQYSCFFNNTNTFYFRTHNTTPTQDDLTLTTNSYFVNGSWNHVACTYDGVNKKVYVNGAEAATKAYTQTLQTNPAGTAIIGAYGSGTSYFFNGKIDEVKISNVGRSAEEIAESYRAGRDKYISLNNFSATDLSSKASLPFYIAADRPGTYLTATIGESNFANYQPDANTVALWHLDERSGSGAYIKDSSDNANNGSTTSTTHVEGKIGKGRLFSNSSIALSSGSNANVTGDITLDMWIKPNSFAAAATPIHKDSQYSFQINTSGQVSWADSSNWNYAAFGATNIGLTTGNWQHLAFTKTGGTVKIYLNGVEKASKSFGGALTSTANIMNMGCYSGVSVCGSAYFNGSLDEVRISNIARSASEIRQAYEVGLRSHPITIDFAAIGAVSNVISSSTDTSFNIDATAYGLSSKGSGIYKGDKIIVRENYNGTEYIAQGTVRSVTPSIGAITVSSWDAASTFPAGGFTENADFFKWQQEYWPLTNNTISSHMDGINTLTLKQTDGQEGRTIWLDSFRSGNYLTNPAGSTLTSSLGRQYLQYRAIFSSFDPFVSPSLSMVSFAATTGPTPYLTPTPMPAYDGDTGGVQGASSCYLEESRLDNSVTLHWTDGATDEIGYEIEKQINNAEEWQFVDITTPNAQSYSDTDVAAGNIYRYRVRKRGDDGATGDWCGTQVIDMRTGNAQIEGLKIQGVRID